MTTRTPAWRRALAAPPGGRRAAFRAWRHSRPFSGGLLLVIAGIELLAIPLAGLLLKGALKLVIYIGIGGVFGVLTGVLLIVAGIVLWVNPTHRIFYGVAGIVLGILSFPASNLGGFLIAMLLAIIGGSLAFAWEPDDATEEADADDTGREPAGPRTRRLHGRSITRGHRVFAVAAMPALLVAGMLSANAHASTSQPDPCVLGIICLGPSPSPSGGSSTGPSTKPSTRPSAGASPSPGATSGSPSSGTGGEPGRNEPGKNEPGKTIKKAAAAKQVADPGLTAPCATSVLNAGSATLTNFAFNGIVDMPVGCGGGTRQMMEFTASSATLSGGVTVTVTQGGQSTVTTSPTLGFSGGMALYATKLCGRLAGIPLCFTPSTVSAVLLRIANLLTGVLPITLTNVVTNQPLALANGLRTGPLSIGF